MESDKDYELATTPAPPLPAHVRDFALVADNNGNRDSTEDSSPTDVPSAQDWDGPHDPENPMNWSIKKRVYHTAGPALLCFTVTLASSLITPASRDIERHFHVSETASILPLTLYVFGLGLGPTLAAGPSEVFGRSIVYKVGALLFMLFTLGAGWAQSFAALLVTRFFAGFCGGPVIAVASGTMADVWEARKWAVAQGCFLVAPFLGPALGPTIGGFAAQYKGWRWTQWCALFVSVPVLLFVLPGHETYKRVILSRRAKRLGLPPPPTLGPSDPRKRLKFLLTVTMVRPIRMLFTEPLVGVFSLYTAFNFSILFAFLAAYPYVYETQYGFNTWQYGLTFLAIGLGVLLGSATSIVSDRLWYQRILATAMKNGQGRIDPEYRLHNAMIGSFGIPIGLLWFGWTARSSVHWIVPTLAGISFGWGNLCVFSSCLLFLTDVYGPLNGASASAANGFLRYTLGAVFPLFTIQMYRKLGIDWASSLLGFISIAMLPIPWVFFKLGSKLRARSQFGIART